MAKKTKASTPTMSAEEKKWRVQRNADILREAYNMSAQDKVDAKKYLKEQMNEIKNIIKQ